MNKDNMHRLSGALLLMILVQLSGCATTRYSDGGSASSLKTPPYQISAHIKYKNNPDYLPRSIIEASSGSSLVAEYIYEVSYGMGDEHVLTVFNPLLLAGMSKTEDSVFIGGQLKISRGDQLLKKYEETVTLSKRKTLYSEGETMTDIRKKGLLHVRDKIDQRINEDKEFWRQQSVTSIQTDQSSGSTSKQ